MEKTPISVEWTKLGSTFDSSIQRAIDVWNHSVGCKVLVKATDPETANVKMAPYDGFGCGKDGVSDIDTTPGAVAGTWRCSPTTAEIRFKEMSDMYSVYVEAGHEFGHLLGLDHDGSVFMSPDPKLYDPAAFGERVETLLPYPAEADAEAIATRYCHKK